LGLYVESIISKIVLIPLYRLSMNAVQEWLKRFLHLL
jgi:hypothetical protein